MKYKIAVLVWIGTLFLLSVPAFGVEDVSANITRANELYHEKNYAAAAEIYQSLAKDKLENGYLYYNLGNTHMRLGETGKAILNYLRAKTLLPRDENLDANLRYAIRQTQDQLEPPQQGLLADILFWGQSMNVDEHLQLLILFNAVFWLVSLGKLFYRKPVWSLLSKCSLGFLVLMTVSAGVQISIQNGNKTSVVLEKQVDIKSDQGVTNVTLFQLHEGAIVSVLQESGDWAQISLGPDKAGWLPRNTIVSIKKTGV